MHLLRVCAQGSGWGWLGYNKASKALDIVTCANQDPLAAKVGLPLSAWQVRQPLALAHFSRPLFPCSCRNEQPVAQQQSPGLFELHFRAAG